MRKFVAFLLLSLMTTMAWGERVITFIPGETSGIQPTVVGDDCMYREGVTICTTYGAFAAAQFRFGKNSVTRVTSEVGDILRIVFYCTADNPADGFTEPPGMEDGVWEGRATEVVFVAGKKQVRATKIEVTVDDATLSAPVITPESGTYYNPIEVSITCYTTDAKIYYTLNGDNPTTASNQYTAPFILKENAVVKAVSVLDGEMSEVVCAEYEFGNVTPVRCFEDAEDVILEEAVRFSAPVYVLAQNRNYLFAKDECGAYALFFGPTGQTYKNGDVIPAGFVVEKRFYNGEPEFYVREGFMPAEANHPIEPEVITADQVGHEMFAHYVRINDVKFSLDADGKNYILTDSEGNTCPVYFGTMGTPAPSNLDITYTVVGIVGSYGKDNIIYQLLPVFFGYGGDRIGLGDLLSCPEGSDIMLDYDAVVIVHSGRYMYLKDETGYGMVYGTLDRVYSQGDVIPAGYGGTLTEYSCQLELMNPHDFQAPTGHVELEAERLNSANITESMWGHYVTIPNAQIDWDQRIIIDEKGNVYPFYNSFNVVVVEPNDPNMRYDVYCVVGAHRVGDDCIYQLLLVKADPQIGIGFGLGDLGNVEDNTEVFLAMDATVLGQAGKYLYLKDDSGYGIVYGNTGINYRQGDVIPAGYGGMKVTYDMEPEVKNPVGIRDAVSNTGEPTPEPISSLNDVNHDNWGKYVKILVRINPDERILIDEAGDTCSYFDRFGCEFPIDLEQYYYVYAIVSSYKTIYQLLPIRFEKKSPNPRVRCFEDVYEYPPGVFVQFDVPIVVAYQSGNNLFVKDECGQYAMMYGNVSGTFVDGDSIIGSVAWTEYPNLRGLIPKDDWHLVAHGPKVEPFGPVSIEDITTDLMNWYIYLEDVTVTKDEEHDSYYTMTDENGDEMLLYNQFGIKIPTYEESGHVYPYDGVDIRLVNLVIEYILTGKGLSPTPDYEVNTWNRCRVEGLVTSYHNGLELRPTKVTTLETSGLYYWKRFDVNNDGVINISDVNVLINIILMQ